MKKGAFTYGLLGIGFACLLLVCILMIGKLAAADDTVATRDAFLGEQDRSLSAETFRAISSFDPVFDVWLQTINGQLARLNAPPLGYYKVVEAAKKDTDSATFQAEMLQIICDSDPAAQEDKASFCQ